MKYVAITPDHCNNLSIHPKPDLLIIRDTSLNKKELAYLATQIEQNTYIDKTTYLILHTNGHVQDYLSGEVHYNKYCLVSGGGVQGFHLNSKDLLNTTKKDMDLLINSKYLHFNDSKPKFLVGASCHNEKELDHATELELDYCLLSPIYSKYDNVPSLGWEKFQMLVSKIPLPVFALGGLSFDDEEDARKHNAAGIAGIRMFNQSS